jgi:exonuclease VII large subunit
MAEFEFGGMTFRGGKMMIILTALSTAGGAAWGGFEVYKDYMDMKEIIQNIDVQAIENSNNSVLLKMDEQMIRIEEAIEYTRDIKQGLRDDILGIEKQVDRMEDKIRETEEDVRQSIANAEERFENKRDALQNDYDEKANRLAERNDSLRTDLENKVEREITDLEDRLGKKLQRALDNPLAN